MSKGKKAKAEAEAKAKAEAQAAAEAAWAAEEAVRAQSNAEKAKVELAAKAEEKEKAAAELAVRMTEQGVKVRDALRKAAVPMHEVGMLLCEVLDWQPGRVLFAQFCESECGFTADHGYRIARVSRLFDAQAFGVWGVARLDTLIKALGNNASIVTGLIEPPTLRETALVAKALKGLTSTQMTSEKVQGALDAAKEKLAEVPAGTTPTGRKANRAASGDNSSGNSKDADPDSSDAIRQSLESDPKGLALFDQGYDLGLDAAEKASKIVVRETKSVLKKVMEALGRANHSLNRNGLACILVDGMTTMEMMVQGMLPHDADLRKLINPSVAANTSEADRADQAAAAAEAAAAALQQQRDAA